MCGRDILDKVLFANEVSNSPASGIEVFTCRADSESSLGHLGGECCHAGERDVEEPIIHFIREDDEIVLDTEIGYFLEFLAGHHFAHRVMADIVRISKYCRNRAIKLLTEY